MPIFGRDNETVRKHFISDVLEIPLEDIKSVRLANSFLWKRRQREKLGILDVQLTMNDSTKINIEMQLKYHAYWKNRTVFYLAKMFTADLRRGEKSMKIRDFHAQEAEKVRRDNNFGF